MHHRRLAIRVDPLADADTCFVAACSTMCRAEQCNRVPHRSGANLQEVIMSKAYAVNANFQGVCGLPIAPPSRMSQMLLAVPGKIFQDVRPLQ